MLDAALGHPGGRVGLVHHEQDRLRALVAERFEGVHGRTRVCDRRLHVRYDEKDHVRRVQHGERLVGELRGRIDDDVVVVFREQHHRGRHVRGRHELRFFGTRRPQEDRDAARSFPENFRQRCPHALPGREVHDGTRRRWHLQHVTDRTELHDAVHQRDRVPATPEDGREIHRDQLSPRWTLARQVVWIPESRIDPPGRPALPLGRRRAGRLPSHRTDGANLIWSLDSDGNYQFGAGDAVFTYGLASDIPVVGRW